MLTRRHVLATAVAAPAILRFGIGTAHAATTLKVSHQFPGGTIDKGIVILTWVWQAGGVASRTKPIVAPEDAKGLKVRGGSREMDMVLQTAGAAVLSVPSNELYAAMQTGACDAGITSSTSLISFRL